MPTATRWGAPGSVRAGSALSLLCLYAPATAASQMLLLARTAAFVGTTTSNVGGVVTKLMGFLWAEPVSLDLSCRGLSSMRNSSSGRSWPINFGSSRARSCSTVRQRPRHR